MCIITYTIAQIKNKVIPIVEKYGVDSFSLFESYAKGEAKEGSDLDFVMDKGKLHGLLEYIALVNELENEFNCHVDLVSKGSSNKKFLEAIANNEVLLYERIVKLLIEYCDRIEKYLDTYNLKKIT